MQFVDSIDSWLYDGRDGQWMRYQEIGTFPTEQIVVKYIRSIPLVSTASTLTYMAANIDKFVRKKEDL